MTTSKLKRYGIPAVLVAGGVTFGTIFSPIGLASASENENENDANADTEAEVDNEHGERHGRRDGWRGRRGARIDAVTEALGLSAEQVGDGLDDGKSLADQAAEQGVPVDELQAALVAAANQELDEAVEEGLITAEQADRRREGLDERIEKWINRTPGEGGHGRGHGRRGHRFGKDLGDLSEILGLSEDEIKAELVEGKSLAEIGEAQGVSAEELADEIMAEAEERIDEALAEGKIDADRAAEAKEHLEEHVDHAITKEFDGGRPGRPRNHSHFGDGPGPSDQGEVQESGFSA